MGILGVTVFTACSDDESYPTPTALDASTLSYEAKAGAVKLKWKIPENANYKYIKVTLDDLIKKNNIDDDIGYEPPSPGIL